MHTELGDAAAIVVAEAGVQTSTSGICESKAFLRRGESRYCSFSSQMCSCFVQLP